MVPTVSHAFRTEMFEPARHLTDLVLDEATRKTLERIVDETLGPRWMTPDRFRFGASSLLNDVLMQIEKERTGRYQDPDDFTID